MASKKVRIDVSDIVGTLRSIGKEVQDARERFAADFRIPDTWMQKYEEAEEELGKTDDVHAFGRKMRRLLENELPRIQRAFFKSCPDHFEGKLRKANRNQPLAKSIQEKWDLLFGQIKDLIAADPEFDLDAAGRLYRTGIAIVKEVEAGSEVHANVAGELRREAEEVRRKIKGENITVVPTPGSIMGPKF